VLEAVMNFDVSTRSVKIVYSFGIKHC